MEGAWPTWSPRIGESGNLGLSDHGQDPNTVLGGDWNMVFMTFHILGFSSSQLTKSYFSKGLKPPEFCLRTGDGRSRKALGRATWILGSDRSMVNFTKWGSWGPQLGMLGAGATNHQNELVSKVDCQTGTLSIPILILTSKFPNWAHSFVDFQSSVTREDWIQLHPTGKKDPSMFWWIFYLEQGISQRCSSRYGDAPSLMAKFLAQCFTDVLNLWVWVKYFITQFAFTSFVL